MAKMFAYGSNLDENQMLFRCPNAVRIGSHILDGYDLVFKVYADIQPREGARVYGGLWEITEECEDTLDRYEGVADGLYTKEYFFNGEEPILFYKMSDFPISPPKKRYADILRRGYLNFGLPLEYLEAKIDESKFADGQPPH